MAKKAVFAWSGGKDSALALREIQRDAGYRIVSLMTTVTRDYDRVCMHGIRTVLIEQQATGLGLPLDKVYLEKDDGQEAYDAKMGAYLERCRRQGVEVMVFGDIFLEDLREYREDNLAKAGLKGVFPLWQRDTKALAQTFVDSGFEAVVTCVDGQLLSGDFVGRCYDRSLLADLPEAIDPCGERGEFHSFVHNGPMFRRPIAFERGSTVLREKRFHFVDLAPVESEAAV